MESIPKFLASVITIILGVLLCVSLVIAGVVVNSARVYHDSVIDDIEASNFDDATIASCIQIAKDNGYLLKVEPSTGNGTDARFFYKVTLTYRLAAPVFGTVHTGDLVGYALSGAQMDVVVPGVEPGLYETGSGYSKILTTWSDLEKDGVISINSGVVIGSSTRADALVGDLLLPRDGSVTEIANSAFTDCTNLTGVKVPNSVTRIGKDAFSGCRSLKDVELGSGIASIDSAAFAGCGSISSVNYIGDVDAWCDISFADWNANPVYNDGVGADLYYDGQLVDTLIVPTDGTSFENKFVGCTSIRSLLVPDGSNLNQITDYAFYGCKNLLNISIGTGILYVGDYAFGNCTSLRTITISNTVSDISTSAFSDCGNLQNIFVADGNADYRDEDGKALVDQFTGEVIVSTVS